jgi:hypothetical protein
MKLLALAWTFWQLNRGQTVQVKLILKEATDLIQAVGRAMKDGRISAAEKQVLVKELRDFTKATVAALDVLVIPE